MKYLLIMLLSMLALFPSCDTGNTIQETGLKVIIEQENTRGFVPHSMDVDHYELNVVNQDRGTRYGPHILRMDVPAILLEVDAGNCIVSVDAYNASNTKVGVGRAESIVEFGKVATCNVSVMEENGNGTISFSVKGISSDTVNACLYTSCEFETSKSVNTLSLAKNPDGLFEGKISVPNGYYVVVLEDANGLRLSEIDTCRIIKDCNISCSFDGVAGNKLTFANVAQSPKLKLAMVTDSGTVNDGSFNQGVFEGIKAAADELGADWMYLRPNGTTTAEYIAAIADLYDSGYRFVACPGFLFDEAITEASAMFPDMNLVIVDSAPEAGNNVVSVLFKEQEAGFLAGFAAALQLKTGSFGFVGGIEIPPVQKFNWGFQQGIKYANENFGTKIEMKIENFIYSNSFSNPSLGQDLAKNMYDSGVNCILQCAGGVGVGVINECKNRALAGDETWVVGVDVDQYKQGLLGNGKSCILTSAVKDIKNAVADLAKAAYRKEFPGGTIQLLGAADDRVDIPESNPNLSAEVVAEVEKVRLKIASGEIVVRANSEGLIK